MNQYTQRHGRQQHQATAQPNATAATPPPKSSNFMDHGSRIAAMFVIFTSALLVLASIAVLVVSNNSLVDRENDRVYGDGYQAVFLDSQDGQVYFGKLKTLDTSTYQLSDIYYVRVQTAVQPETGQQAATDINLAKLGDELHGPQDVMYIQKSQVLFWENLTDGGQVVCAIRDYQQGTLGLSVSRSPKCDEREQQAQTSPQPASDLQQAAPSAGDDQQTSNP